MQMIDCGPKLNEKDFDRLEAQLRMQVSPAFKEFYLKFNGGYPADTFTFRVLDNDWSLDILFHIGPGGIEVTPEDEPGSIGIAQSVGKPLYGKGFVILGKVLRDSLLLMATHDASGSIWLLDWEPLGIDHPGQLTPKLARSAMTKVAPDFAGFLSMLHLGYPNQS